LLNYATAAGLPPELELSARMRHTTGVVPVRDPWHRWVFSVEGTASVTAEESTRSVELGLETSADRITPTWKITIGTEIDHTSERFDVEEEQSLRTTRREREVRGVVVRSLDEHWSVGGTGEFESSTFENISRSIELAPAVEWNYFPYSDYPRRQLCVLYELGLYAADYYEETLFGRLSDTRAQHSLSTTYEQREPWGSLQGRFETTSFVPDAKQYRLELESEVSLRVARGLALTALLRALRIRDQISLPRRGATPEEVLLRLRRLQSGYELDFEIGLTYQFGSPFRSMVNPRFGQ
jgi:hypothetical protein